MLRGVFRGTRALTVTQASFRAPTFRPLTQLRLFDAMSATELDQAALLELVKNGAEKPESVSKNAWKKALKLVAKEKKDAEKKAKAAASGKKALTAAEYEAEQNKVIADIKATGEEPYPHKFDSLTVSLPEFRNRYQDKVEAGERLTDVHEVVAGRVQFVRRSGKKLAFYTLVADGAELQVLADLSAVEGEVMEDMSKTMDRLTRGDIIGVHGSPAKSKNGELSIVPTKLTILSSCLAMLPKRGLKDVEQRYRHRWLDLIMNHKQVRPKFETRAQIIAFIRRYLDSHGFLEVETPMMNSQAGGATARPFLTHHNELGIDMQMRIAPELYLKMLIVGGLDRVYEIGRQFRNEGIDLTHNPEFTTCEFYWAYQDYEDLMQHTEQMLSTMVQQIKGTHLVDWHADGPEKPDSKKTVNWSTPFRRISFLDGIVEGAKQLDPTFAIPEDLNSEEARVYLAEKCEQFEIDCSPPQTTARLLDKLCEHFVESKCVDPTFITDHPAIMSPLAKHHRSKPQVTERFELFVLGKELCNAYTELNDPRVQQDRFEQQMLAKHAGDDEVPDIDFEFIRALEHGLPPTAGWGLGIDRLTMFLSDSNNIREVLLFPAMRPQEGRAEASH
ncbi:MAG: hypothetical protein MHM6MM_005380 [Cercozoa sp. M6MM]